MKLSDDYQDIIYTVVGGVCTITINRPHKMNSVTAETLREVEIAFDRAGNTSTPERYGCLAGGTASSKC